MTAAFFDCATSATFEVVLTASVDLIQVVNVSPGRLYTFDIAQDATGNHSFPWQNAGAFDAAPPVSPVPLSRTSQTFVGTAFQTLAPIQNGAINQG